jgi:hypothetical protein
MMMCGPTCSLTGLMNTRTNCTSDISFAALQVQMHGFITNSMIIVLLLHGIYIVDFFWNEDW